MYFAYVVKNNFGKTYTGSTANIDDRILMHNDTTTEKSRFHRSTYKKGPWHIIFQKSFISRQEAQSFERYLKTGNGRS
jgi:predicted GIY-YIG superfamily endonuclease